MALAGLSGKVVIVTGGASGIGRGVVERLLAEGASAVAIDRDEAAVGALGDELASDRLLALTADVTSEEDTERYFGAAVERFGRVDGLHANAGIAEPGPSVAATTIDSFDRQIAVNVKGVFLGVRRQLRQLAAQGTKGSIVTTASVLGVKGMAGSGVYCASKFAVVGLTRAAAIEAGPDGHRINAVLPGPIATPMSDRIREGLREEERAAFTQSLLDVVPLARMGEASEVAAMVAWLLSDESSYVTGGAFSVDGGQAG
jgi:NAD(P)-dependent dehydrogenase (short-subunit alcohol dehydrogenase family)